MREANMREANMQEANMQGGQQSQFQATGDKKQPYHATLYWTRCLKKQNTY